MLSNDKVFVLVHEQERAVGDLASIVIHRKTVGGSLRGVKPGLLCQSGAYSVCQVLHSARLIFTHNSNRKLDKCALY